MEWENSNSEGLAGSCVVRHSPSKMNAKVELILKPLPYFPRSSYFRIYGNCLAGVVGCRGSKLYRKLMPTLMPMTLFVCRQ